MSIIRPNFPLIKKTLSDLNEIRDMSFSKSFDKDHVLGKVKLLIDNLTELNVTQEDTLAEYKRKNKELFEDLEKNLSELSKMNDALAKYTVWSSKYLEIIRNNMVPAEDFLAEGKEYEKIIEEVSKKYSPPNVDLMNEVMRTYIQMKFTKKRKRAIWINYQIFRLNIFYRSILNVIISAAIGFGVEKIMEFIFPDLPDLFIGILTAILSFLTLEKILGDKFSSFFWRAMQRQCLRLYIELETYMKYVKFAQENHT